MTDLNRLADLVRGCDMLDADRDYLTTLLRSAAAETVGTVWDHADTMSAPYPQRACVRHNADLSACRLALVAARKERDEARADAAWWMDTVREVCNHVLGNDRWDPRDRAVGTPIVQAVAAVRKERDEAAKMAYMILPSDDRNPGVTWREAYEMLDEKFLGEKHGHDCAMSTIAEERAALQRAIDEAIIFVEGHLTDENRRKLLAATLRPHATPSQPERQWSSTPPSGRSGKWWNAFGFECSDQWLHLVPNTMTWDQAENGDDWGYDLWLPYVEGDTRDSLPPLPNSSATVTSSPAPASRPCDCRELVARLAECVRNIQPLDEALPEIIRDARGGGA